MNLQKILVLELSIIILNEYRLNIADLEKYL